MFAEEEAALLTSATQAPGELEDLVRQRIEGVPLEHLLGWVEFLGMRVNVAPEVFVPRRRTEFLVTEAIARTRDGAVVLEPCCGCGAIGAALTRALPNIRLYATELDAGAVRCARRNLEWVYEGDLFEPLPDRLRGQAEMIVANAPYVPTEAIALMPPEAREYEPRTALDGGVDGLDIAGRIVREAPRWLTEGGRLLIETSQHQAARLVALCTAAGMRSRILTDPARSATVVLAEHR